MPNVALAGSTPLNLPRAAVLRDPLLNKGTAFTESERDALGLRGLLPAHVLSLEEQAARVLETSNTCLMISRNTLPLTHCMIVTRRCFSGWYATTSMKSNR